MNENIDPAKESCTTMEAEMAFFPLAERFRSSSSPDEIKRLGDELGRFVFGR